MAERYNFHTPVGRFVSGSLTDLRTKDYQGRPLDNPHYDFGVAIRKDDAALPAFLQGLTAYAKGAYAHAPTVQQHIDGWLQTLAGFSMKITDGDKANQKGNVNENTRGCFVIWFSSNFEIQACNAQNTQIDPATIKRGWFVDVAGNAAINGLTDGNAGIYMNPNWVRLIAEGDEITGSVDPNTAFGGAPVPTQLPPGARPVGSAPAVPTAAGLPGTGLPGAPATPAPGAAPAPGLPGMATASPGEPVTPATPGYPGILTPGA